MRRNRQDDESEPGLFILVTLVRQAMKVCRVNSFNRLLNIASLVNMRGIVETDWRRI